LEREKTELALQMGKGIKKRCESIVFVIAFILKSRGVYDKLVGISILLSPGKGRTSKPITMLNKHQITPACQSQLQGIIPTNLPRPSSNKCLYAHAHVWILLA
jgi:hypothetical protein